MVAANALSVPLPPPCSESDRPSRALIVREAARYDATLVLRFNSGDDAAFDEIIARYRQKIFAYSYTLLRSHPDAEEIAQDTFIKAHRHLRNFRGECSLAAWLHTIALNLSRNRYWYLFRRRYQVTQSLDCALSDDSPATFSDLAASDDPGPVAEATSREFSALAAACITKLTARHREILERRIVQNCSYDDIASALRISVGTVKSRIARAREKLRALMASTCPEFAPDPEPATWFDPVRPSGGMRLA
jgi:RNA polymerase sigma-70 factor (ECF subfamily)